MINNKYKTAKEYMDIVNTRNHFERVGIKVFIGRNTLKFIGGCALFVVGLVSFPIPFITIPLLVFACGLMGYNLRDLMRKKQDFKLLIKYKYEKWKKN